VSAYYSIDDANLRVDELRPVLEQLRADRDSVAEAQNELQAFRRSNGSDDHARELQGREARIRDLVRRMQRAVGQIETWGITLRDIETGLVDFPALANGRPIWLCWRLGEGAVDWWHEMDEGFAGRRPLITLE
jgi:hypothetical protein